MSPIEVFIVGVLANDSRYEIPEFLRETFEVPSAD
jgi:hypothetical protein